MPTMLPSVRQSVVWDISDYMWFYTLLIISGVIFLYCTFLMILS